MESKQELRSRLLTWRQSLSPVRRAEWSEKISRRIVQWPLYKEAHTIHCFRSMSSMGEVETGPLLEQMWRDGKRVVVPRMDESGMASIRVTPDSSWHMHPLGMMEPEGDESVPVEDIDMVLVPLLAADRSGHRLGYGKGMYDRFLSTVHGARVGLLFSILLQDTPLPVESHDVPLTWIVTERSILKCDVDREL